MDDNHLEANGSTVCVTIAADSSAAIRQPAAASGAGTRAESGTSAGPVEEAAGRPRTLLLVDDEENILAALRRLLRRNGYRILTATSGREGLELLASNEVDVIISDQRMPNMTGVEFLRQAKLVWPESIRMVLSGYTELQSIADAINEGAIYKFLTKPWEDEQLREQVEGAFHQKGAADERGRLLRELAAANIAQADLNSRLECLLAKQQTAIDRDEVSLQVAQEILEHIPVPVIGVDANEMITFANSAALGLFVEFAPMLGADARDVLPAMLLADGDPEGTPLTIEYAGRAFAAVKRSMGAQSASQGRVYVLMPARSQ
jgi:CheY-like chemotaxis protein